MNAPATRSRYSLRPLTTLFLALIIAAVLMGIPWRQSLVSAVITSAQEAGQDANPGEDAPPSNNTCAGAQALQLNRAVTGTLAEATNDYELSAPGGMSCFTGAGQVATTAPGRDIVYSFTAASAGTYSFRVQFADTGGNMVVYLSNTCPVATPPTPVSLTCDLGGTPPIAIAASNRNTATVGASEEIFCQTLSSGQQVFLFVDELTAAATGTDTFTVEVSDCARETEPNSTPATANLLSCGVEGTVDNTAGQDGDFFQLGSPAVGSRVFAMVDGAASNGNFDLRLNTSTTTLQFDDFHNDAEFGATSANISGGVIAAAAPTFLQVDTLGTGSTVAVEPYRLFSVVQPPIASATAETEPNNTPATANTAVSNYFSATLTGPSPSTDVDVYATTANAGDLLFVGLDGDPLRDNTGLNSRVQLLDAGGNVLLDIDDNSAVSNLTPGTTLTSTTPSFAGEALVYRIQTTGVYFIRVDVASTSTTTAAGDYLLSISKNCGAGGGGGSLPGPGTLQFSNASYTINEGGTATITVARTDGNTGTVTVNYTTSDGTATGGASCPGADYVGNSGTLTFADGENAKSFTVPTCADAFNEGLETVNLTLSMPGGGATIGSPNPAVLNINDIATQFCNTGSIAIPGAGTGTGTGAPANPYPSSITVSGLTGSVRKVRVTLNGFSHASPDDVDIMLVGPGGQNLRLLSDAGGTTDIVGATLTFDDAAPAPASDAGAISSGTYQPTNYGVAADAFPAPAPAPSAATTLSIFNGTSPNGTWSLYVVDDLAGSVGTISGGWCIEIQAGFPASGTAICDFDGDAKTDISVFRPGDGNWHILQSMTGSHRTQAFGAFGDTVTPGDYDGDGKWDIAVWRSGVFYVLRSSDSMIQVQQWGVAGDDARVIRDYDGDGKTDYAVYRRGAQVSDPSFWFILQSSNGMPRTVQWGNGGDVAAPADYDGDSKADIGVYSATRPTGNNTFYVLRSSDGGFQSQQFGVFSVDVIIVEGDFNGDARDDYAAFRFSGPEAGTWYTTTDPSTNFGARKWGIENDAPAPGDYDGDGKTDLAVFRPSTGFWFILRSSDGASQAVQWGQSGDILTMNYTLR